MEVEIWGWSNAKKKKKSLLSILVGKPLVGRRKKKKLKWLVLFKMLEMPPFGEASLPWV